MSIVWCKADSRASVRRMSACPFFLEPFASWWNSCNLPKVALTNNAKIYAHHPENRSFRAVNLCLIVARYYIYTAAKESDSYSITAFKVLLKSKLSAESPSIRASVSF